MSYLIDNSDISKFIVQTGVITWTGTGSGWSYAHVTFPTPYKSNPIISVLPNTAYANPAKVPAIRNQFTTGFDIGFYNYSGTFQFMWWAFGEEE